MKTKFPWYLLFIASVPLCFLYAQNQQQTEWQSLTKPLLISNVIAVMLWVTLSRLWNDSRRAGLICAAMVTLFFAFGHLLGMIHGSFIKRDKTVWIPGIGPTYLGGYLIGLSLVLAGAYLVFRFRKYIVHEKTDLAKIESLLFNISLVMLLMQPLTLILKKFSEKPPVNAEAYSQKFFGPPYVWDADALAALKKSELPDIYYIMPDGYARADVLEKYYEFDNGPFLESLKSKGFQVVEDSYANFYWTLLSLGATLNMDYVTPYAKEFGVKGRQSRIPQTMIRYNRVMQLLQQAGYEYVQTTSTWAGTRLNPSADRLVPCDENGIFTNDFYRLIVETSLLRPFLASIGTDLANCHLNNFAFLNSAAKESSPEAKPRFIFTHFLLPHHPYLFDADGTVLRFATIADQFDFQSELWKDKKAYVNQLRFVNGKIEEAVASIISNAKRPVVILIASDHGPHLDFEVEIELAKKLRLNNFIAIYSSDKSFKAPRNLSLINMFRLVFNHHLGTHLDYLKQKSFYSSHNRPFLFSDIHESDLEL